MRGEAGPAGWTQIAEGFGSCTWLWTTASGVRGSRNPLSKEVTRGELGWNNTDSGKSRRGLNGSFRGAAGGEALGIQSPAGLPGKRSPVEPALEAA